MVDVTSLLHAGANTIAVQVKNRLNPSGGETPARLHRPPEGRQHHASTRRSAWKTSARPAPPAGSSPRFDDTAWTPARELATYGSGPWGGNVSLPPQPSPYLRKDFTRTKPSPQARLYVSALGLYEVHINGRKVGDQVLAPGWTEYTKRVPSQTYDVTDLVKQGDNAIGAVLGDGWYAGRLQGGRKWGTTPALLAQLKLTYADGTSTRITTDSTWQAGRGGLQATSIYDGETYDARLDKPGWDQPGFNGGWSNAVERNETMAVEPSPGAADQGPPDAQAGDAHPARARHLRSTTSARTSPAGRGCASRAPRARRSACASARSSTPTARSTPPTCAPPSRPTRTRCAGTGAEETYEPRFTYHGFRYVEVTGFPGTPTLDSLDGREVSTDLPEYGTFTSSNALVNQIQSAIRWGQRSNFLAVPSDASQRDERLGWTGDIQAFASTAAFNGDASGFLGQWLQTLRDSPDRRRRVPRRRAGHLLRRGHRGLGRRRHGRPVGALPPLRRHRGSCRPTTTR